ncbi:MAG: SOS response-associated peptidase [Acidobacteriota bacterium]
MCGRYIIISGRKVFATFELMRSLTDRNIPYLTVPRYNAAPMQKLPVIVNRHGELQTLEAQWWIIPHWSKNGKADTAFPAFNARADRIETSKLFGPYFKARRCLVPVDGFYEWAKGVGKEKIPMCIRMKDEKPFMLAGVYSIWKDKEGAEVPSFAVITTDANELMAGIHNRMPVILAEQDFDAWLDPQNNDTGSLKALLRPFPSELMKAYPVSTYVNSSRNEGEECMKPVSQEA